MDSQKQQAAARIKQANNILVTVSNNPSVDQLSACIGLTLVLNKMGKHATAVFSGQVPSTLEFLQPEKTIEKNTDSLRDFIISLDKSKADKLRYKVEDKVVKIFITPYRTSISDKDLDFSQGDFNVDVVLALGVHNQTDLDQAITSHGRILHDATIITLNSKAGGEFGSINWIDPSTSSLSELAVQLVDSLDKQLVDGQIATAFLTGIVAETERFSNGKTSPRTMSISAELMGEGANQQLVALKLEEPAPLPPAAPIARQEQSVPEASVPPKPDDGTLEISHIDAGKKTPPEKTPEEAPTSAAPVAEYEEPPLIPEPPAPPTPQIKIDERGEFVPTYLEDDDYLPPAKQNKAPTISRHNEAPKMVITPPALGGALNASDSAAANGFSAADAGNMPSVGLPNEEAPRLDEKPDTRGSSPVPPLTLPDNDEDQNAPGTSFLGDQPIAPTEKEASQPRITMPAADETLSDIERDVHSSHLAENSTPFLPSDAMPAPPTPTAQFDTGVGPMLPPVSSDVPVVTPDMPDATSSSDLPMPSNNDTADASLDNARDAVMAAINGSSDQNLEPVQALNAQHADLPLGPQANTGVVLPDQPANALVGAPVQPWNPEADQTQDPNAPPAVPPPMMPQLPSA